MQHKACQLNPQSKPGRVLHLELWTEDMEKESCLKKDILTQTAVQFMDEYEHLRTRSHPRFGRGWDVRIAEFLVFFLAEMGFAKDERDCLLKFLKTIGVITEADCQEVQALQSQMLTRVMREEIPRTAATKRLAYNVMAVAAAEAIAKWLRENFLVSGLSTEDREKMFEKFEDADWLIRAMVIKNGSVEATLRKFAEDKDARVLNAFPEEALSGLLKDKAYVKLITSLVDAPEEIQKQLKPYSRMAAIARRFGFVLLK